MLVATDEAIRIGREAGLPVHISHMKASGRKLWGKAPDAIALVEKARKARAGRHGGPVSVHRQQHVAGGDGGAAAVPRRRRKESLPAGRCRAGPEDAQGD